MSMQQIYNLPQVRKNDFQLFKEAIGLIPPQSEMKENDSKLANNVAMNSAERTRGGEFWRMKDSQVKLREPLPRPDSVPS